MKTEETEFENSNPDPGFEGTGGDNALKGREDKREHDIDVNLSIKEMREGKTRHDETPEEAEGKGNPQAREHADESHDDALNYQNDREHGSFNPKNI
ncbi:hypothetical protein [Pedobacter sp. JY14-1]|uniref:hypothetical protein n=1 Tax=Pedobacter sp. JY14-1 TaxID=3034151 RepID=UPI0023E0F2D7|nr:hypothetical protein [Pedobacter sp. JY14-1]